MRQLCLSEQDVGVLSLGTVASCGKEGDFL